MRYFLIFILACTVFTMLDRLDSLVTHNAGLQTELDSVKRCKSTREILELNAIYERYVNEGKQDSAFKYFKLMTQ